MAKLKTGRHTSAIKAARQAERKAARNRGIKKGIKSAAKDLQEALSKKDQGAKKLFNELSSTWDKAAKSGVIHWKTAARKKARMASKLARAVTA
jgi:small subunit ribosomal protein S20